jgi:hypothetical protein
MEAAKRGGDRALMLNQRNDAIDVPQLVVGHLTADHDGIAERRFALIGAIVELSCDDQAIGNDVSGCVERHRQEVRGPQAECECVDVSGHGRVGVVGADAKSWNWSVPGH